jgi:hypothetical protein
MSGTFQQIWIGRWNLKTWDGAEWDYMILVLSREQKYFNL